MKKTIRNTVILALVALLTIGSVLPVFADDSTAFVAARGTTYYTFDYAGDESDITIEAYATPGDANAMSAFELKLLGPDGSVLENGEAGEAVYTIETSSDEAGTYTLVFTNYHEDLPITVTLFVNGDSVSNLLSASAAAEAVVSEEVIEEETTDEEATVEEAVAEEETASTETAGTAFPATTTSDGEAAYGPWWVATGRAFTYAIFEYAGDESTATVELGVNPGDANAMSAVVLKIYDADGELVATGEADDAMYIAEIESDVAGTYVIEAISYNADLPLGLSVVVKGDGVSGAAGISAGGEQMDIMDLIELSAAEAGTTTVAEETEAEETEEADTETTESTVTAGSPVWFNLDKGFAEYTFDYAGTSDEITIEVWPIPGDALAMSGVNVKLFAPDGSLVDVATSGDAVYTIEATISTDGTYTIEVANYHEELPLTFCLKVTGSNVGTVAAE